MSETGGTSRAPRRRKSTRPAHDRKRPIARDPERTLSRPATALRSALAVAQVDFKALLRDRRALFSAFVLPILLYPILFLGNSWLERVSKETLSARNVRIALELSAMPAQDAQRMEELLGQQTPIEISHIDGSALLALGTELETGATVSADERKAAHRVLGDKADLLVLARPLSGNPAYALRTYFDGQTDIGNEAERRAGVSIDTLQHELFTTRVRAILGADPAHGLDAEPVDVASAADQSGATLGRFLPLLAVFVLLAGASYAALSAFAGERESGTLETLLVQPVTSRSIVTGKFVAVLVVAIAALVLNAGSVLVSLQLGLGTLPGGSPGHGLILDGGRLFGAAFLFLPAAVFLCAVLCLVCGRARTFREGQQLLLPLLLVAILPVIPATQSDVALDPLLAAVPLCGPALALRDALRGDVSLGLFAWMFVAQCIWAVLALSRLSTLLDAEKVVQGVENEAESQARNLQSRVAIRWAIVGVFAVYLIGATLQSWNIVWGLAATLWLVLLPLAILAARGTAHRAHESLSRALWIRLPHPLHALGALLLAPAMTVFALKLFEWQQHVLPMPSSQGEVTLFAGAPGEHTLALLLLIALSPAICEELFFRGALLSGLRRDLPAWKIVAFEMLFFGAVHMSIYRFAPTAILGGLLAWITLRSRSILPAMLLHATYNGMLVLKEDKGLAFDATWNAALWAGAVLGVFLLTWRHIRRES